MNLDYQKNGQKQQINLVIFIQLSFFDHFGVNKMRIEPKLSSMYALCVFFSAHFFQNVENFLVLGLPITFFHIFF